MADDSLGRERRGPGAELSALARRCADAEGYPDARFLADAARAAREALAAEREPVRRRAPSGEPGGLVRLLSDRVLVVPDLHARTSLLADLLSARLPDETATIADSLAAGTMELLLLGDILHSEDRRGAERWTRAASRLAAFPGAEGLMGPEMDEEMGASLFALLLVMRLKALIPGNFHCLKGNHDNAGNFSSDGDAAFYKFAMEGAMGSEWLRLRYGGRMIGDLRAYELLLPILAAGRRFCASHAEPAFPLRPGDVEDYRRKPELVAALIWTGNGESLPGSVPASLRALLGEKSASEGGFWLSGHRPVPSRYSVRGDGLLYQIHDPRRRQVALVDNSPSPASYGFALLDLDSASGLSAAQHVNTGSLDREGLGH